MRTTLFERYVNVTKSCDITVMFILLHPINIIPECLQSYTNIVTSMLRKDNRIYVTYL